VPGPAFGVDWLTGFGGGWTRSPNLAFGPRADICWVRARHLAKLGDRCRMDSSHLAELGAAVGWTSSGTTHDYTYIAISDTTGRDRSCSKPQGFCP